MSTPYLLKVQAIRSRGQQPRLYVYFPLPLAAAIGLEPGEAVQWVSPLARTVVNPGGGERIQLPV
jgi:hypothetical protein